MDTWAISKVFVVVIVISISCYLIKKKNADFSGGPIGIRLPMQETCVSSPVHMPWAVKLEPWNYWSSRARTLRQEKPLQWEGQEQRIVVPACSNWRKPTRQQRPSVDKNKLKIFKRTLEKKFFLIRKKIICSYLNSMFPKHSQTPVWQPGNDLFKT